MTGSATGRDGLAGPGVRTAAGPGGTPIPPQLARQLVEVHDA